MSEDNVFDFSKLVKGRLSLKEDESLLMNQVELALNSACAKAGDPHFHAIKLVECYAYRAGIDWEQYKNLGHFFYFNGDEGKYFLFAPSKDACHHLCQLHLGGSDQYYEISKDLGHIEISLIGRLASKFFDAYRYLIGEESLDGKFNNDRNLLFFSKSYLNNNKRQIVAHFEIQGIEKLRMFLFFRK